ncbi:hypothetical protein LO772_23750 [Yinghuangia sp. ASG 101]|uniref:hypothetical protein n=1 Tax=Yinghuangia sp. ASG 101 TaxID=2896848 RepID=UPI001E5C7DD6|nr:hypothetical protein [Yinghuangia sp. ASG 101]UGQ09893.1 hypothetical protein LO772_23750 [Yinghuangia sp. ASG 101]
MRDAGPTRRTVLAGLGALVAAGVGATACTSDDKSGPTPQQRKADDDIRDRATAAANTLLDRYAAVAAAHPSLTDRLRPCSDAVGAHLTALGGARTPPPAPGAPAEPVPADEAGALADLAARELQGSDGRLADVAAASPDLARLLASVSACQYVHAKQLGSAS